MKKCNNNGEHNTKERETNESTELSHQVKMLTQNAKH